MGPAKACITGFPVDARVRRTQTAEDGFLILGKTVFPEFGRRVEPVARQGRYRCMGRS
jgi:hypothetical protein